VFGRILTAPVHSYNPYVSDVYTVVRQGAEGARTRKAGQSQRPALDYLAMMVMRWSPPKIALPRKKSICIISL